MRRCCLVVALGFSLSLGVAGQDVRAAQFFGTINDIAGQPSTSELDRIKMPWIEAYEFRTETRDFDVQQQELTIRLSPSTPALKKAQEKYALLQANQPNFELEKLNCERVESKYESWIEAYAAQTELALVEELLLVLEDKQTILLRMAESLDFDWSELVSNRTKLSDLTVWQSELQSRIDQILITEGLASRTLDFSDFKTLEALTQDLQRAKIQDDPAERQYDIDLIDGELAMERAERKRIFDFAQFRYQGGENDPFREKFAVGMAFKIPDKGSQRIKIRELEAERASLSEEITFAKNELVAETNSFTVWFEREIALQQKRKAILDQEDAELQKIYNRLSTSAKVDPLLLLDIKARKIRNQINLHRWKVAIVEAFVDHLDDTDQLCTKPYGRWLY